MKETRGNWNHEDEDAPCVICEMLGIEDVVLIEELARRGLFVWPPDEIDAEQIPEALAEIGRELAELRVFIEFADHLDDVSLYRRLYDELQEPTWISPGDLMSATHIDFTGTGSEEDCEAWLMYYADESDREDALRGNPERVLPERRPLPYDRSGVFPPATYGEEGEPA